MTDNSTVQAVVNASTPVVQNATAVVQQALPSSITSWTSWLTGPLTSLEQKLWPAYGTLVFPLLIAALLGYWLSKKAFTPKSIFVAFTVLIYVLLKAIGL